MREIHSLGHRLRHPHGTPSPELPRTWVDDFVEKSWPKIKAKWAKLKARLRARGPDA